MTNTNTNLSLLTEYRWSRFVAASETNAPNPAEVTGPLTSELLTDAQRNTHEPF